jgi:lipid II:glycine glycyltransferase (peptidoglycan interpeptide bridge formation enzyme)
LPPQPFSFFRNIHRHAISNGLGIVVLARWRNVPVAGAMFFQSGDKAIYKFGASDDSFQQFRGNNLVFRDAISWLSKNGVRKLDLGRTSIANEGLRRFKLGWNADETTIGYYRFCLRQKAFVSMPDEGTGWHNQIFKTLPLPISRIAGELLYRHWA